MAGLKLGEDPTHNPGKLSDCGGWESLDHVGNVPPRPWFFSANSFPRSPHLKNGVAVAALTADRYSLMNCGE